LSKTPHADDLAPFRLRKVPVRLAAFLVFSLLDG